MKTLTFLTVFLLSINLNAQVFAPHGAVWYYTYDPEITLDDGYQKIEVVGDTLIDDKICKILQKTNIGYSYWDRDYYEINAGINIIYEEDSIVYYKKDSLFYILYDFKAKVGDSYSSISFPENCNQQFEVKIDSIENVENNGKTLRKFYVTLNDSYRHFYIERIGYPEYLIPYFQIGCDVSTGPHYPGPLRCYADNEIGNFSTNIVSSCEYIMRTDIQNPEYTPFNLDSGEWYCVYSTKGGMFGGNHETYYATDSVRFYCSGDTVINDIVYKKLLYSGYTSSQVVEQTFISGYYGAIRNDTLSRKVLFVPSDYNSNQAGTGNVLYDFNLSIGDSIQVSCFLDDKEIVSQIDSVLYCNRYHKRYSTPSGYYIIEGIGSKDGFIPANCSPNHGRNFCYREMGNDLCSDCGFFTSINLYANAFLKIFPNPAKGKVQIVSDLRIQHIELLDVNGRLVDLINDDFHTIELKEKGFYLLRIYADTEVVTSRIINE